MNVGRSTVSKVFNPDACVNGGRLAREDTDGHLEMRDRCKSALNWRDRPMAPGTENLCRRRDVGGRQS